jgi:hypothetical protein
VCSEANAVMGDVCTSRFIYVCACVRARAVVTRMHACWDCEFTTALSFVVRSFLCANQCNSGKAVYFHELFSTATLCMKSDYKFTHSDNLV